MKAVKGKEILFTGENRIGELEEIAIWERPSDLGSPVGRHDGVVLTSHDECWHLASDGLVFPRLGLARSPALTNAISQSADFKTRI